VFVFTRPDGTRIPGSGAERHGCFRGNNSGQAIESLNLDAGLSIDARTSRCRWLGERMDYSLAIEGMQWREANAAARRAEPPTPT